MKSNEDLQRDVQEAIKWEPLLKAAEIGVTAKGGVITLSGIVESYAIKSEAEAAAKSVIGVKVVVEQIEIKTFNNKYDRNDNELANEILTSYKSNWGIPSDKLKVKVEKGWITLEGEVPWNYQRDAAERLVKNLAGVKGVTNLVTINPETHDKVEKIAIESALARNWSVNDKDIHVHVLSNKVILTGIVGSWYERDEAERQAWKAPGVEAVDNEIIVEYHHSVMD